MEPRPVWPPSLWWGDRDSVQGLDRWQKLRELKGLARITHVCNLAAQPNAVPIPLDDRVEGVSYLDLEMLDAPDMEEGWGLWARSERDLRIAVGFVDKVVSDGGVVLVNCYAGQNRSGAVLLAWLLTHRTSSGAGLGFTEAGALSHLRAIEPQVLNNKKLELCALQVAAGGQNLDASACPMGTQPRSWVMSFPAAAAPKPVEVQEEVEECDLDDLFS